MTNEIKHGSNKLVEWFEVVQKYNSLHELYYPEAALEKKYAEEFYNKFKIDDASADNNPLDEQRQIEFYTLLEFFEERIISLNDRDEKVNEILEETASLKTDVHLLTQNTVGRQMGKNKGKNHNERTRICEEGFFFHGR